MKTAIIAVLFLLALPVTASAQTAPGGPGADALWTEADKDGYGTSAGTASKVWHTLDDGRLTEVFYPDLGTPSVRTLDFIVSDGKTFAQRDSDAANRSVQLIDSRSLTYRQVNEQIHKERLAAIEKGLPYPELPPYSFEEEEHPMQVPHHQHRSNPRLMVVYAAMLLAGGFGAIAAMIISENPAVRQNWSLGLIPMFMGIGALLGALIMAMGKRDPQ